MNEEELKMQAVNQAVRAVLQIIGEYELDIKDKAIQQALIKAFHEGIKFTAQLTPQGKS